MLPVTTRPPRRPGAWGSPFGRPREIDLSEHDDPHHRPGHHLYVLPKSCWIVACGSGNSCKLTYGIDDDDHGPDDPWRNGRVPEWGHLPYPPKPSNRVLQLDLIKTNSTGVTFADGQNVTIEGSGKATIIQVFSS